MKHIVVILSVLVLLMLSATSARADSDGYFCIGNGYVAYQFGLAAPPVGTHRLYVVRFGDDRISEPFTFDIPQFQVHGMQCRDDGVHLASFAAVHTVSFDPLGRPARHASVPLAREGALPAWTTESRNLGMWSRAFSRLETERYPLLTEPDGSVYELVVAAAPDSVRECPPRVSARVEHLSRNRAELGLRLLFDGLSGAGECIRRSFAPLDTGTTFVRKTPADLLLDALVFGPPGAINVTVYPAPLREEFREYLLRADAYRTTRPPAGGMLAGMVDHVRIDYERAFFAATGGRATVELAVALVDSLKPCYEWEGFHDCPEHDAIFADAYLAENPTSPFVDYLPLFSAHRWLCAAEGYETEQKPADAARSMRMYGERLEVARASRALLFRTAAEQLRDRGTCHSRG